MATILLVETATSVCSVGLARQGRLVSLCESNEQRSHAALITVLIQECLNEARISFNELDAVAVSRGPGSYTGLRIGVSTAKGVCYAKDIPLIAINTLQAMANGFSDIYSNRIQANDLLIPMIDAKRMEVYATVFTPGLETKETTKAIIIDTESFANLVQHHKLWLFGDGADKCHTILSKQKQITIVNGFVPSAGYMARLAQQAFVDGSFEDVAYFEPFYLKDFVAAIPKVKGLE